MPTIDSAALADLKVLDAVGDEIALSSLWARQTIALALVRHFG
jgi:hypothetical protein